MDRKEFIKKSLFGAALLTVTGSALAVAETDDDKLQSLLDEGRPIVGRTFNLTRPIKMPPYSQIRGCRLNFKITRAQAENISAFISVAVNANFTFNEVDVRYNNEGFHPFKTDPWDLSRYVASQPYVYKACPRSLQAF